MKVCAIDGCGLPVRGKGWCSKHYTRWRRNGDPLAFKPRKTVGERFAEKVKVVGECHEWQATRLPKGYGVFAVQGVHVYAHRFAYEQAHGPIPPGLYIDHLCGNKRCCNPAHLEAVTPKENSRRVDWTQIRTHCPHGHPYSGDNLFVNKKGSRECRTCRREAQERHWRRKLGLEQ